MALGGWRAWKAFGLGSRCKTLLGLSPDAAVTYPCWVNLVHPDDRAEANGSSHALLIPSALTMA